MSSLHDLNDIASGDPHRLRAEVEQLRTVTENIDVVLRLLRAVSTHGVWESPAGETFAAQVGATPEDLDLVCARLHDAAAVIGPYADRLEDNQRRLRDLDERHAEASRTREARDEQLAELPAEHPDRPRLTVERGEAAAAAQAAAGSFERESDEALGDEKRAAARLVDLLPELADPKGYDSLEGLTNLGTSARSTPLGMINKPIRVAGAAEAIGMTGRKIVYDEGSWRDVGVSATGTAVDVIDIAGIAAIARAKKATSAPAPRNRWTDPPPSARYPSGKAFASPIAGRRLRDVTGARTRIGAAAQRAKHDLAEKTSQKVRDMTGVSQLEQFEEDVLAVAGSRAGSAVVVTGHSARHAARVARNADSARRQLANQGLTDPREEREQQAGRRR